MWLQYLQKKPNQVLPREVFEKSSHLSDTLPSRCRAKQKLSKMKGPNKIFHKIQEHIQLIRIHQKQQTYKHKFQVTKQKEHQCYTIMLHFMLKFDSFTPNYVGKNKISPWVFFLTSPLVKQKAWKIIFKESYWEKNCSKLRKLLLNMYRKSMRKGTYWKVFYHQGYYHQF